MSNGGYDKIKQALEDHDLKKRQKLYYLELRQDKQ